MAIGANAIAVDALVRAAWARIRARCAGGRARRSARFNTATSAAPSAAAGTPPASAISPASSASFPYRRTAASSAHISNNLDTSAAPRVISESHGKTTAKPRNVVTTLRWWPSRCARSWASTAPSSRSSRAATAALVTTMAGGFRDAVGGALGGIHNVNVALGGRAPDQPNRLCMPVGVRPQSRNGACKSEPDDPGDGHCGSDPQPASLAGRCPLYQRPNRKAVQSKTRPMSRLGASVRSRRKRRAVQRSARSAARCRSRSTTLPPRIGEQVRFW